MRLRQALVSSLAFLTVVAAAHAAAAAPEVGQPAPEFRFEGADRAYASADYVGEGARKKGVVVAWFPKAFTPG